MVDERLVWARATRSASLATLIETWIGKGAQLELQCSTMYGLTGDAEHIGGPARLGKPLTIFANHKDLLHR